jgi:hypothetical protein
MLIQKHLYSAVCVEGEFCELQVRGFHEVRVGLEPVHHQCGAKVGTR